jgi:hypothetical protein
MVQARFPLLWCSDRQLNVLLYGLIVHKYFDYYSIAPAVVCVTIHYARQNLPSSSPSAVFIIMVQLLKCSFHYYEVATTILAVGDIIFLLN